MKLMFMFVFLSWCMVTSGYAETDKVDISNLPPDPGEEGKATLAGIDSDNDGVRDDLQRWIALTYPNSAKTRAALTQNAKAMQQFLFNAPDSVKSYSNALQTGRVIDCLAYIRSDDFDVLLSKQKAIFLNTNLRSKTWLQANRHLSGKMFKGLDYQNWKQGCDFNPDTMPN
jgi:hypothetical protein